MIPMYKISIDLVRVNKAMQLKFNLLIEDESPIKSAVSKQDTRTIHSFMMGGSEYLKIRPHPYITIDISKASDRGDAWNSNLVVNLTAPSLFVFQKALKKMLEGFHVRDLFFKQNGKLMVNFSVANPMMQRVRTSNRMIALTYAVVPDEENKEVEYEGICFMINSVDNYCYLTYNEIEFLLHTLSSLQIHVLSMQALQLYYLELLSKAFPSNGKEVKPQTLTRSFSESKSNVPETPPFAKVQTPSEIPEI